MPPRKRKKTYHIFFGILIQFAVEKAKMPQFNDTMEYLLLRSIVKFQFHRYLPTSFACVIHFEHVYCFFPTLCMYVDTYGYIYFDVCFLFVIMMGAAIFIISHRSYRTNSVYEYYHTYTCIHTHAAHIVVTFSIHIHAYVRIRKRIHTHTNIQAYIKCQCKINAWTFPHACKA